jgi:hypothetical protein
MQPFVDIATVACPAVMAMRSCQYLVLGWALGQRDLEVLIKLVGQICFAAAAEGGATIVVLTMREKLEMEDIFRYSRKDHNAEQQTMP